MNLVHAAGLLAAAVGGTAYALMVQIDRYARRLHRVREFRSHLLAAIGEHFLESLGSREEDQACRFFSVFESVTLDDMTGSWWRPSTRPLTITEWYGTHPVFVHQVAPFYVQAGPACRCAS